MDLVHFASKRQFFNAKVSSPNAFTVLFVHFPLPGTMETTNAVAIKLNLAELNLLLLLQLP